MSFATKVVFVCSLILGTGVLSGFQEISQFMRNVSILLVLALSIGALTFTGCDTGTTSTATQTFGNVVWKPDGSGMYGYFDNTASGSYSLGTYNSDGSSHGTITTSAQFSNSFFSPTFILSADGAHAVTQLGENLYRIDLPSGNETLLTTKVSLFTVSPDLNYAIVTPSIVDAPVKTISVLNIGIGEAIRSEEVGCEWSQQPFRRMAQERHIRAYGE